VDEAYAGDIIGFTTHGGVQLGDTITDGAALQFTGLPFFRPRDVHDRDLEKPAAHQAAANRLGATG
jgi:peptide subunit release factor RF-3